jgi:endonuclease/exonuclease/phosphatase (EEP) superfamily protein YafD
MRLYGADAASWQIAVLSALPWELALTVPLLVLSVWRRKRFLAGVALLVLVFGLIWEGPVLWPISHAPRASASGRFRIFDENVAQDNFDLRGIAAEIRRDHPAVVTLEELTPPAVASLTATGVMAGYHWSLVVARPGPNGMGIWSNIPMTGLAEWNLHPYQSELEGWLHPAASPAIRIDVLHVYGPVGGGQPAEWRRQLATLAAHLAAEPRPLVVAGDFNATEDDSPFRAILADHLADAAVLAGRGWEMSWPRDQAWVIPYLRIDHVLVSPQMTVTGYRMGIGHGSDHHPLIVEVALRSAPNLLK